jgi:hypothetical protein
MAAYLKRIVPTFPDPSRVILSGSSAGGYGALANWWQTQQAFGDVRVDLIDVQARRRAVPRDSIEQTGGPPGTSTPRRRRDAPPAR